MSDHKTVYRCVDADDKWYRPRSYIDVQNSIKSYLFDPKREQGVLSLIDCNYVTANQVIECFNSAPDEDRKKFLRGIILELYSLRQQDLQNNENDEGTEDRLELYLNRYYDFLLSLGIDVKEILDTLNNESLNIDESEEILTEA